ncbi:MAG: ATP-binding protein [Coriobacteriales bacterium]|jgi:hypothetical protein
MNIAEAKEQVKTTVRAYLEKDELGFFRIRPANQRPVFLIGAPGIGKTAIMEQIASELGIGLVSYSMTHHTRQSALGLPMIVHRKLSDGTEFDISEYTMSEIIGSIYDYREETGLENGILFLDEINCVSETLYPSMLQFLQFKTFGRHKVPDGWIVVCAGNPPEYNRSVHEFDIVTLDRMRKIEVEPDYETWKDYARTTNVHPAILTYLDVRPEDFYVVESTPEGKSFVSARGWSDLSVYIKLLEDLGCPVDKDVVSQFLQHEEVAERFAAYYDLFDKYKSDYQIESILNGTAPETIAERAKAAEFDERLALLGLILDRICGDMRTVLEQLDMLTDVRDDLRASKAEILDSADSASAASAIDECISSHNERAQRANRTGVGLDAARKEQQAINLLKELKESIGNKKGQEAFNAVESSFEMKGDEMKDASDSTSTMLDNAFEFIERTFGNEREMLVFVTELTARWESSQFIGRFGSDSYYAHNQDLMVERTRDELFREIDDIASGNRD